MAYADQEMSGNRIIAIIIVALIHIGIGYLLVTGLAISAVQDVVERVTTVDIEEEPEPEEEELPPPPPEPETAPPPPVAPPPPISIAPAPPQIQVQPNIPPPAPPVRIIPPPAPPAARPAPPPPPPPPPSQARPVQRENYSRWARQIVGEGYPSRAIRQELEGTVGVSVSVGTNGRVTECSVTRSSGESILDEAACDSMRRYARYDPALNDAGNPVAGRDAISIVYQLPD